MAEPIQLPVTSPAEAERRASAAGFPETGTPTTPGGGPEPGSPTRRTHEASVGPTGNLLPETMRGDSSDGEELQPPTSAGNVVHSDQSFTDDHVAHRQHVEQGESPLSIPLPNGEPA